MFHTLMLNVDTPDKLVFGQDMIFELPYAVNWEDIQLCKQKLIKKFQQTRKYVTTRLWLQGWVTISSPELGTSKEN